MKFNIIFRGYLLLFFNVYYEFNENTDGSMQKVLYNIRVYLLSISQIMKINLFYDFFSSIQSQIPTDYVPYFSFQ
jgi:hypothetical protein